ncbi:MAG: dephospho-CoA kinase [Dermatophilaceae bacterium]
MLRLGLTGGIGSGKSSVAGVLRELGALVTDADLVAREIVEPGRPALAAIAAEFGSQVIRPDGTLDRPGLAAIVFPSPERLLALEAITDPAIAARAAQLRAEVPPDRIDVYDFPLLVERGSWVHEHLTLVVGASERVRVKRLVEERGLPERDAQARIAAQADDEQRRAAADLWVDNDGSRQATRAMVQRIWHERLVPYDENLRHGIRARRPEVTQLVAPDPKWPAQGSRVVARIAAALAGLGVRVEHVGSTAVPRLPAMDVIDVQVGVRRLADADQPAFGAGMRVAGYLLAPGYPADRPPCGAAAVGWEKRFYGGADPGRVVHVQVRETGSAGHDFTLALRDWLRALPAERDGYAAEKGRLAGLHPRTRDYGAAKQEWFDTAYRRVMAWTQEVGWTP